MSYTLQPLSGQNVLITGGLGFIGSNLAIKCLELGAKVALFTRTHKNFKNIQEAPKSVTLVVGDITNYADVEKSAREPQIIFHLAGQTSNVTSMENPLLDINTNLIGTLNVLEACRKTNPNAKIIFAGTVTEHGKAETLPIKEALKDNPLSIYETNKLIAEKYLQIYHKAYGLHTCCLRLPTLFGERQQLNSPRFGITNFFLGRIWKGEEIKVFGEGKFIRDYNYIGNVVDAFLLAAQNKSSDGEVFCLGTNRQILFVEMVQEVIKAMEELTGKKGSYHHVEFPAGQSKIDVGDTRVDYSKLKEKLGWEPQISFEEGIRRTIRFYLENNRFEEYLTS
ncbi:SDR family NAD(P)-dependent oxidoreductase [Candidatus Woesearchaeota archaeon]|nr:SDR family NAD(P)-dependent oxidoreductase [Candidatus Woesearchaeota archaeon]